MESYKIENLSFSYPNREKKAIDNISLTIKQGEFITICGKSGCGKTTLLRLLKTALSPFGELSGNIYFEGEILAEINSRKQAEQIGFVMQSPDNQLVTDKVWHELAFGLESLGFSTAEIRTRVSEMASFFGIQTWFHKKVTELSGGQKQLLNLASVMVMQPKVLILDEPTSQLDPIAAEEFLKTIEKINQELGITVILSEHRLEDAFPISDRVIVMDKGKIIAMDKPARVGKVLKELNHDMLLALPTPMRVYSAVENELTCPLTVRDGRNWLEKFSEGNYINANLIPKAEKKNLSDETVIDIKDVWFRYEKDLPDIIKGLNMKINKGELFAIVGGNGTGKTTALSLISGLNKAYRGEILINGENISRVRDLYKNVLGMLPQNPQNVFLKKTVYLDLMDILSEQKISKAEKEEKIKNIAVLCRIDNLLDSHPYDLSGGEQQRAALAKILLLSPQILLLDEPTKGLDAHFKEIFAEIINDLRANSVTIVMVSHDIEFCAKYADKCAMFFDGNFTSAGEPRGFFAGNNFYTTAANRMARTRIPEAVLTEDIILACGGKIEKKEEKKPKSFLMADNKKNIEKEKSKKKIDRIKPNRIILGGLFGLLFAITILFLVTEIDILGFSKISFLKTEIIQLISIVELTVALFCFFPQRAFDINNIQQPRNDRRLAKRTLISAMLILLAIPFTIYIGVFFLGDRKYYFISLLIIFEIMQPFCMLFEGRKPQARELVILSVLCAIAVAGRAAFFMLPQFKPVFALVIIVGVCFGGEAGFLVGAMTGFVSNFFFGQGPWTPWQMFAFGIIGFLSGILFKKGWLRKYKVSLCIFGFLSTMLIYGGIMNPSTLIITQNELNFSMLKACYITGLPFDLVHSASTVFFLWFMAEPMIDKLERIKIKYGLIEE